MKQKNLLAALLVVAFSSIASAVCLNLTGRYFCNPGDGAFDLKLTGLSGQVAYLFQYKTEVVEVIVDGQPHPWPNSGPLTNQKYIGTCDSFSLIVFQNAQFKDNSGSGIFDAKYVFKLNPATRDLIEDDLRTWKYSTGFKKNFSASTPCKRLL